MSRADPAAASAPHAVHPAEARTGLDSAREIVVVRALALGDLLVAVPFLRALRGRFPDARISLIGLPWASELVARFDRYLDGLVPFPGWPGIPEAAFEPSRTLRFLAASQANPPDLAIQAHGNGTDVNAFVALLGARHAAGYVPGGRPAPAGTWIPYPGDVPEVRRHLRLAAALGADPSDERLEWPVGDEDRDAAERSVAPERLPALGYAVVHPGATNPVRRWPVERFAAVGDHLAARGLRIVLTGSAAEGWLTAAVAAAMRVPAVDLAGRTSLGALGALLADARLLVTNDTGIGHLADALGTPSVRVFRASDPRRWAALDATRHAALAPPDLGRRCSRSAEPGHPDCRAAGCLETGAEPAPARSIVPVEAAIAAVDGLLGSTVGRVA